MESNHLDSAITAPTFPSFGPFPSPEQPEWAAAGRVGHRVRHAIGADGRDVQHLCSTTLRSEAFVWRVSCSKHLQTNKLPCERKGGGFAGPIKEEEQARAKRVELRDAVDGVASMEMIGGPDSVQSSTVWRTKAVSRDGGQ